MRKKQPSVEVTPKIKELVRDYGQLYSEELGIDLSQSDSAKLFKWFIAALLFGARISETIAKRTYKAMERHRLLTPEKILAADIWDLIKVMGEGGYVRYDGKTSNELKRASDQLLKKYEGNLNQVHARAKNSRDLEEKLQEFYSVGPVTCRIFLRELRGIWKKADPETGRHVRAGAKKLGIKGDLKSLKNYWRKHKINGYDFRHFEVALLRLGKRPDGRGG